ncbi:hypothetical protein BVX97_02310 [bacterium E08(2017)]|nr:hypothetical protein BVX97_02310 [bacterium E08(2017)]
MNKRWLRNFGRRSGKQITLEDKLLLNLSSNDYMGYAADNDLLQEFYSTIGDNNIIDDFGPGSSASRLLSGNHLGYSQLEETLESLYGRPALVYTSGYHANIGILTAVTGKNDLIIADRLAHASIIDGIRLAAASYRRFPHMDYSALRQILSEKRKQYDNVFIVTESLFSMDGDVSNLAELVDIKKEFDAFLYLDEAHAVGAIGPRGLGVAEEQGALNDIDLILGTFGKALGGLGAFAICSKKTREHLVNNSRSLIYTTALPPVTVNWNNWILNRSSHDTARREHLAVLATQLRNELTSNGIETNGSSHIVPAIIGSSDSAVKLADKLMRKGFLSLPIRPPTVPENTSRLRFSLSASMNWTDISPVTQVLAKHHKRRQS